MFERNWKTVSGQLPKTVENLLEFAMLKSMSERLHIASVERQGTKLAVRFHPETPLDPAALVAAVRSRKGIRSGPQRHPMARTTEARVGDQRAALRAAVLVAAKVTVRRHWDQDCKFWQLT